MKTISRYLMTLALLLTAVMGAWAADKYTITFSGFGNEACNKTVTDATLEYSETFTVKDVDADYMSLIDLGGSNEYVSISQGQYDTQITITVKSAFEGTEKVTVYYVNGDGDESQRDISVTCVESPIEVTTNAASEQDLFTEAWFTMPTSDVTVNYTLVRDMQDQANPVAFTGLPTTTTAPIIVKKGDNGKYQPAETLNLQLIDPLAAAEAQNIIAADGITVKVLVGNGGTPIEYDQDNPITLEDFLADMKPGYYWIKAEPTDENSPYDGTVYSSEFTVVEQYDLTVKPANDFSKKGLDAVTVGTESITIDANTGEATKTGIAPDTEVKIKAKRGYVIDKVEAKKKAAPAKPEYADNAEELPANTKLYMRTDLVYNGDWIWNPTYTAEQAQAVANYYAAITGTKCAVIYGHGSGTDIYYVTSDNGVNETIYRNNDLTEKFPGYKVYLLK